MSESLPRQNEVAVIFHTDDHIFVPPFEIARERRRPSESNEQAFYRISGDHGVTPYSVGHDTRFSVLDENDDVINGYLMQPRFGELDNGLNEFAVPLDRVHEHLAHGGARESALQLRHPIDREIILAARALILARKKGGETLHPTATEPIKLLSLVDK